MPTSLLSGAYFAVILNWGEKRPIAILHGLTCGFDFETPLLRAAGTVWVSGTPVVGLIGLTEGSSHVVPMETSHTKL